MILFGFRFTLAVVLCIALCFGFILIFEVCLDVVGFGIW